MLTKKGDPTSSISRLDPELPISDCEGLENERLFTDNHMQGRAKVLMVQTTQVAIRSICLVVLWSPSGSCRCWGNLDSLAAVDKWTIELKG